MDNLADRSDNTVQGVRFANVIASITYPIVSAWEFEFLKEEQILRERWDGCTVYMVVQRPLTFFDHVVIDGTYIHFEIADGTKRPLRCRIDLVGNRICRAEEILDISIGFYSSSPGTGQPYRNVGAFQIYREDGSFVVWWSPQKILYEMLIRGLAVEVEEDGDPFAFLDFKIHYIGKSFSQKVWKRLTGHTKMQKILTREREVGPTPEARAPFEISLIILKVVGLDDMPMVGDLALDGMNGASPIMHTIDLGDDHAYERFVLTPPVQLGDEALTREVEALLINRFRPEYNQIKFDNYPDFEGGMRSKGYTATTLTIEGLPAFLYTDHFSALPTEDAFP